MTCCASISPTIFFLRAARADAATGLLDIKRLGEMLSRIRGRIVHKALDHVSPLSVPVLLEIGRETRLWRGLGYAVGRGGRRIDQGGDELTLGGGPQSGRRARAISVALVRSSTSRRSRGALYWPEHEILAVADLHLEKGSSFAARGNALPPYDTASTLARLSDLIADYAPRCVVALGDSFHDGGGPARLGDADRDSLRSHATRA